MSSFRGALSRGAITISLTFEVVSPAERLLSRAGFGFKPRAMQVPHRYIFSSLFAPGLSHPTAYCRGIIDSPLHRLLQLITRQACRVGLKVG
jgi:hypothetical protein